MVELAKALRTGPGSGGLGSRRGRDDLNGQIKLTAAVGFQDTPFLITELKSFCNEVIIASEKGTSGFRGNVLEMMEQRGLDADYYLSCGPKPMLAALAGYCRRMGRPLQVSLEERMGCGYGACVGCTCKTRGHDGSEKQKKVCLDGPVFFGEEVIWDD
jgi:dihydroorotate dehydrogenase electron transfer subunit